MQLQPCMTPVMCTSTTVFAKSVSESLRHIFIVTMYVCLPVSCLSVYVFDMPAFDMGLKINSEWINENRDNPH